MGSGTPFSKSVKLVRHFGKWYTIFKVHEGEVSLFLRVESILFIMSRGVFECTSNMQNQHMVEPKKTYCIRSLNKVRKKSNFLFLFTCLNSMLRNLYFDFLQDDDMANCKVLYLER